MEEGMFEAQGSAVSARILPVGALWRSRPWLLYLAGNVAPAGGYWSAATLGQALRYTASVSAVWPPVGLGIAVLYLWGLRWWPGILLGEFFVNGQLLFEHPALPLGALLGQYAGNMAEVVVGAWLLLRLLGPRAKLDRVSQIGRMMVAACAGTAISAAVGT